jgi:DNA (cytosine-5)-methyltransferase 1
MPKKFNIKKNTPLNAISLFSGMGGDSLGIVNSGLNLIAYSEISPIFRETHELNFYECDLIGNGDITKTSNSDFIKYKGKCDLVFAGFPCQGFSNAGKKLADDPRNTLFKEFLRATKLIKPKYIIGENVKGLLGRKTSNDENYIDVIKASFEELGYNIYYKVLKAHDYNIPQKRERLIIVGIQNNIDKKFEFPQPIVNPNLNLKDIVTFNMMGALKIEPEDYDMDSIIDECMLIDLDNDESENNPHPNLKLLAKSKDYSYKGVVYKSRLTFGKRIPVGGEIIDIRNPAKTIICTYARQPRFFVPLKNKNGYFLRCLLPDELKQIQGFPKDFKVSGNNSQQIIQIGNAVPPPLIEQIISNLI